MNDIATSPVPARVNIVDVGPRDGFQAEQTFIPTELKIRVIDALSAAGVRKIETTAFVHPKAVPQMADAREVLRGIERTAGVSYTVLVPNTRGAELALEQDIDGIRLVVCASETFNERNVRMSIEESIRDCEAIVKLASGGDVPVEVAIGVAFGCPFEGPTPEDRVAELARSFAEMGIRELSIADTVGMANPVQVARLMTRLQDELGGVELSLHIHNTRGLGFANVLAGLQAGIDTYDASVGGLGGCPVTPAATGNIPTEDLVNMCDEMNIETGIDIERVMKASRLVEAFLERPLPSHVLLAGTNRHAVERHRSL
jgi:hydroxymethylglutaryl-CoA lyase